MEENNIIKSIGRRIKYIKDTSRVTFILIIINVIMYIITAILSQNILDSDIRVLLFLGANENTLVSNGEYYRLFTCMFLHGGLIHLLANMYALGAIGPIVERIYGKVKYIIIYLVGGIISSIASHFFLRGVSIGASGAIFALLGVMLIITIERKDIVGNGVIKDIVFIIVINIFIGLSSNDIDNFAHLGGLLGGVILANILRE
ncbi:rhomboid family protein [Clostridium novyi]|uniref:Conserved membrane protein (Rhomboid family) n=1 Tax=Clostridium novyi (strain NT) TaxID=386415 RepID=A0PZ45_CLONN|nr:rhomboid family intramembrane serine protease [Clostridium novyi]ABK60459.1 conserved membrane protein (rhomboid family) [Clostridium novyi NT]KEH85995.1 protease [Clostridium novyi A str. NCTC 538]KEH87344.1 protease [Clostridium novyi A str. 4540]KEH94020.1 protease [Clostridium novyi A str. GD211209]